MNVGIIGFGLIGQQRAKAMAGLPQHRLVAVFDPDATRAGKLSAEMGYQVETSQAALLQRGDIDVVVIAVPHNYTRQIAVAAFKAGKHVLCEKPLGLDVADCDAILHAAERAGKHLGAGFNYRFYPGIQEAHRRIVNGDIGTVTHARAVMGHGGRPGMEGEWKTSKALCGGGALLDPGIHIIDLVRFLMGPVVSSDATLLRSFWNVDVEDNAFFTLRTAAGSVAQCHISITEWKSKFELDIFGTDGSIHVVGRGGFYGAQTVQYRKRWGWLEKDYVEESAIQYPLEDTSFRLELAAYLDSIEGIYSPQLGTGEDSRAALEVVGSLYERVPVSEPDSQMQTQAVPELAAAVKV